MDSISMKTEVKKKIQSLENRAQNKRLRYSGESHSTCDGKKVKPRKSFSAVLNCCKQGCGNNCGGNDQESLFNTFHTFSSKKQQDTLFSGFMQSQASKKHEVGASKKRDQYM